MCFQKIREGGRKGNVILGRGFGDGGHPALSDVTPCLLNIAPPPPIFVHLVLFLSV